MGAKYQDPTADCAIARADKALAKKRRKEIAAKARQIAAAKASVEEKAKRQIVAKLPRIACKALKTT